MDNIDITKAIIPLNYVLIKLDEDFNTYHSEATGKDTGISIAPWGVNQAKHVSVSGTVAKLPNRLIYHGEEINAMKQVKDRADYVQKEIARLRRESIAYNVPMEISLGVRVYFEYRTRLDAIKEGRVIENPDGKYIFVPYDLLIMAFRASVTNFDDVKVTDIYMLNGMVLVKPLEYATEKTAGGIKGFKTENDLFIPESKQPNAKYVKKGNVWYGTVLAAGCGVKGYADFPGKGGEFDLQSSLIKPGIKIAYDGRHQKRIEVDVHRVIFKQHVFFRIHRKDIFASFPDGNIGGITKR